MLSFMQNNNKCSNIGSANVVYKRIYISTNTLHLLFIISIVIIETRLYINSHT